MIGRWNEFRRCEALRAGCPADTRHDKAPKDIKTPRPGEVREAALLVAKSFRKRGGDQSLVVAAPSGRRNGTPPRVVSTDTGEASSGPLAFWWRILVASPLLPEWFKSSLACRCVQPGSNVYYGRHRPICQGASVDRNALPQPLCLECGGLPPPFCKAACRRSAKGTADVFGREGAASCPSMQSGSKLPHSKVASHRTPKGAHRE